jgi:hypothetical protein
MAENIASLRQTFLQIVTGVHDACTDMGKHQNTRDATMQAEIHAFGQRVNLSQTEQEDLWEIIEASFVDHDWPIMRHYMDAIVAVLCGIDFTLAANQQALLAAFGAK